MVTTPEGNVIIDTSMPQVAGFVTALDWMS